MNDKRFTIGYNSKLGHHIIDAEDCESVIGWIPEETINEVCDLLNDLQDQVLQLKQQLERLNRP